MHTSLLHDIVVGTSIISATYDRFQKSANRYLLAPTTHPCQYQSKAKDLTKNNLGRNADSLSKGIQEHAVRLGPNISETIQRRLSLGACILQVGGMEKFFKQYFRVTEEERLLKASQCYLSTTSGPLAGLLFISTEKVAFCSERSIEVFSQKGQMCRIRYKVAIPLKRVKCVNQNQHVQKPTQKYIQIDTVNNFYFWFMSVLKFQKTLKYLEQAISQA